MKLTRLLCSTPTGQFRPIGVQGEPVVNAASALLREIERRLTVRHRQLFAEPVLNDDATQIDWWTDADGEAVAFEDLSEHEQVALQNQIQAFIADVKRTSDAMIATGVPDSMLVGEWLRAAMSSPLPTGVYRLGDQPVMALWAHEPDITNPGRMPVLTPAVVPEAGSAEQATIDAEPGPVIADAEFEEVQDKEPKRPWWHWPWSWFCRPLNWLPLSWPAWFRGLLLFLLLLFLLSLLLRACSPTIPSLSFPWQNGGSDAPSVSNPAADPATDPGAEPSSTPGSHTEGTPTPDVEQGSQSGGGSNPTINLGLITNESNRGAGDGSSTDVTVVTPGADSSGPTVNADPGIQNWNSTLNLPTITVNPDGDPSVPSLTPPDIELDEATQAVILSLEEERAKERELRARIARLENEIANKQQACESGICLPQSGAERNITPVPERTPAIEQEQLELDEPLAELPVPQQPIENAEVAPQPPDNGEPLASCKPERKSWEAPEVVVVMDTSGSMGIDKSYPADEVDALQRRAMAGDPLAIAQLESMDAGPGDRRIDQVHDGLTEMVRSFPSDIDIGFIQFGSCGSIINHQFYSNDQRGALISLINSTEPQEGTPLARALERAGSIIKGRVEDDRGIIILVSDGFGSCGGNVCAVAEDIARRKPGVTINVVAIGARDAARCAADATGGRVIDVEEVGMMNALIDAAEDEALPDACR